MKLRSQQVAEPSEEIEDAANIITVKDQALSRGRFVTIGNALENSAGIMVQQSTLRSGVAISARFDGVSGSQSH